MHERLLIHRIDSKREVIAARQRARQVASLLGFNTRDQAEIAASTFVLALDALHKSRDVQLQFAIKDDCVVVSASTSSGENCTQLRLQKALPPAGSKFSSDDCRFIAEQLNQFTPRDVFTEIEKQNYELIQALLELKKLESSLPEAQKRDISAA